MPVEQTWVEAQAMPHPPQLFGSDSTSTQVPLQSRPVVHTGPSGEASEGPESPVVASE